MHEKNTFNSDVFETYLYKKNNWNLVYRCKKNRKFLKLMKWQIAS